LQVELNTRAAVNLKHLQEQLLAIVTADLTTFFRPDESGKLRLRSDLKEMPRELRTAISAMSLDKNGCVVNVQLEDRGAAMMALLRSLPGGLAATREEHTGPDGGPIPLAAVRPALTPPEVMQALRGLLAQAEREAGVPGDPEAPLTDRARALAVCEYPPPEIYAAMVAKDEPTAD
jgi:hypothetical protein